MRFRWAAVIFQSVLLVAVANGQTSRPTQAPPPATTEEFTKALASVRPGDPLRTAFAKLDALPKLPVTLKPSESSATLVFSDRPEYFRAGDGIASQDTVPGNPSQPVRFYTYHVPVLKDGKPRRVLTLFENNGDAEATLKFSVYSEPKPSGDYNAMAKAAMADWLNGRGGRVVKIAPHATYLAEGSGPIDKPDLLVHGLFEFTTDQPLRLTVAQVTASDNLTADAAAVAKLPKLPMLPYGPSKDKANRGKFANADLDGVLKETYDTAAGPAQVVVADGKTDPWQPGTDGISGDPTINKGNYGVAYHFKLNWKSSDGRGVAVLMTTSRFDSDCGYIAAAVKVGDGLNRGGVIELPRKDVRFHGLPDACVIQTFGSAESLNGPIDLTYTPPGACCLPIPILLVPIEK